MFRWTADNRQIVPFTDCESDTAADRQLLDKYPAPSQSVDDILGVDTISVKLNRHNYLNQMRRLLQLEELTQTCIIARSLTAQITHIVIF